ncbi:uncharacterized protein VICG_00515 [Vittaforma corneae ATCC 50505]|uniref:Type 1 phosphatases regulator n=1 Tax=Vittaforma corneae (strain ATCC 50505) TaxID=993615 RepID=L2GNK1_VITCO|nr:uncharacterized protein VICG_00515 [Vittaforma corneae ATCC 50505]ELA42416.1 hypothetical protein VICG_00515 [Vittaforma corneae ATCC 50505]
MSITITQTIQKVKLKRKKQVTWTEDTVDNERLNKKSSKVCCIFRSKDHSGCKHKNKYERG